MLSLYLNMIDNPEDQEKFTLLYDLYKEKMFYEANKILNNHYSSEDAVHDAFMSVVKNLHKIPDVYCRQTKNYLLTIVRNAAFKIFNSKKKGDIPMSDEEFFEYEDSGFNLEDECLSKVNYEMIVYEILKLPEIYADVVYLDCVMDMKINEIAEELSISTETAKKRSQRGRNLLKEKLKKEAMIDV